MAPCHLSSFENGTLPFIFFENGLYYLSLNIIVDSSYLFIDYLIYSFYVFITKIGTLVWVCDSHEDKI